MGAKVLTMLSIAISLSLLFTDILVSSYELTKIAYSDLKSAYLKEDTRHILRNALSTDGILAITHVPHLKEARHKAFTAVTRCLTDSALIFEKQHEAANEAESISMKKSPGYLTKQLQDGTERLTLAAKISRSQGGGRTRLLDMSSASPLGGLSPSCFNAALGVDVDADAEQLRGLVDRVAVALGSALDDALLPAHTQLEQTSGKDFALFQDSVAAGHGSGQGQQTRGDGGGGGRRWTSFSDVVSGGDQLEHFHTYLPPPAPVTATTATTSTTSSTAMVDKPGSSAALDYHTDAGLFILFVPALYAQQAAGGGTMPSTQQQPSDFRFKDAIGQEHALLVKEEGAGTTPLDSGSSSSSDVELGQDSLVVMVGQGAEQWLNPQLRQATAAASLRAVPHSLRFDTAAAAAGEDENEGVYETRTW